MEIGAVFPQMAFPADVAAGLDGPQGHVGALRLFAETVGLRNS